MRLRKYLVPGRIASVLSTAVLAISTLATLGFAPLVHAAPTNTWTGGGSDNKFSTAGNWSAGVPVAGMDLVFNNVSGTNLSAFDDLSGVSVNSITFSGTKSIGITIDNPQTVTGNITSTNTDGASISGDITLGADITVDGVSLDSTLSPPTTGNGKTLNLNSHTLTKLNTSNNTVPSILLDITGSGGLTINVGNQASMYLDGNNTFSGTTTIVSAGDVTNLAGNPLIMFGTSSIVVSGNAMLSIHAKNSLTFPNSITFLAATQAQNGSYGEQLIVWNDSSPAGPVTVTMPNITLQGNTLFSVNSPSTQPITVNLAGITANGHCVQYGDASNYYASSFLNGPPACVVAVAAPVLNTPKVPNTGIKLVTSHPLVTFMATTVLAVSIALIARRYNQSASRS